MLGRYRKWSSPKTGIAFLFDIEVLSKTYGEVWRPFDRTFVESLLPMVEVVEGEERLEVWGGVWQEGGEVSLFALLAGVQLSSESISAFYGRLRQKLPEGTVVFAGSPQKLPTLVPLFGVSKEGVFRCAVSVEGASPVLRLLVYGADGPVFSAVAPTPVNLAATVDKIQGVSVRVADMSLEGAARYSEEGDRIDAEAAPSESPASAEATEEVKGVESGGGEEGPDASAPPAAKEGEALSPSSEEAFEVISESGPPTPGGSFVISESDVVSVRSVVPGEEVDSQGVEVISDSSIQVVTDDDIKEEISIHDAAREQEEIDLYSPPPLDLIPVPPPLSDPVDTAALMELLPPGSVLPAPAGEPAPEDGPVSEEGPAPEEKKIHPLLRFAGVSAERTLIDIGDDDITEARPIQVSSPLSSLSDGELRVILTAAPTRETCDRLGEAFGRSPSEIARVFALASGAPCTSEAEGAFAVRAKGVARSVGWVLVPEE